MKDSTSLDPLGIQRKSSTDLEQKAGRTLKLNKGVMEIKVEKIKSEGLESCRLTSLFFVRIKT